MNVPTNKPKARKYERSVWFKWIALVLWLLSAWVVNKMTWALDNLWIQFWKAETVKSLQVNNVIPKSDNWISGFATQIKKSVGDLDFSVVGVAEAGGKTDYQKAGGAFNKFLKLTMTENNWVVDFYNLDYRKSITFFAKHFYNKKPESYEWIKSQSHDDESFWRKLESEIMYFLWKKLWDLALKKPSMQTVAQQFFQKAYETEQAKVDSWEEPLFDWKKLVITHWLSEALKASNSASLIDVGLLTTRYEQARPPFKDEWSVTVRKHLIKKDWTLLHDYSINPSWIKFDYTNDTWKFIKNQSLRKRVYLKIHSNLFRYLESTSLLYIVTDFSDFDPRIENHWKHAVMIFDKRNYPEIKETWQTW